MGSSEWCALPTLNLPAVKVKIDTGAKTSALHADDIQVFKKDDINWVRFLVHPIQKNRSITVICEAPIKDYRNVTSSNGSCEKRYVIETELVIGEHRFKSDVTLTTRYGMTYRMLLGKEALIAGGFIIDVTKTFCLGKTKSPLKLYKT